ncbi:glutamate receptor ionotropic, NMDA 2B-like isoform X1 [Tigriopus californicus]|uniref:glutamate receptor ionotropic, NMDA 2B-like isoform X1 n=2 Tax=Tigriopus californicus TaxID=6832 RepID=UPI0027DA91FC|nr:glutamate receptor ionotropic, NMDA 2B-like isoform X1 [Tigriopus californicus]
MGMSVTRTVLIFSAVSSLAYLALVESRQVHLGLIVPYSIYKDRDYTKMVSKSIFELRKAGSKLFAFRPNDQIHRIMMKVNPGPTEILGTLCDNFAQNNVSAIVFMTNNELFGRSTASSQYFLQLTAFLGIPVITWAADNAGLEIRSHEDLQVHLAPSIDHQAEAMLALLRRYQWKQFSILTSNIAGHEDFIQSVRDKILPSRNPLQIENVVKVTMREDLFELKKSDSRIVLLYCTRTEGLEILQWAGELGLTGKHHVWIVTQSVIADPNDLAPGFPPGMLGVSFDTSLEYLIEQIPIALKVFSRAMDALLANSKGWQDSPGLSCNLPDLPDQDGSGTYKHYGRLLHKYMLNVTLPENEGRGPLRFHHNGELTDVTLRIMNARMNGLWEEVGIWKSNRNGDGLDIQDIVWPENSLVPPEGVPERFHLTIGFLPEPPFIHVTPPDPITNKCHVDRGVVCTIHNATRNEPIVQCCSGFCIDLLEKLSDDLQFEYNLVQGTDNRWGVLENGTWNGLMASLVEKKVDMVLTSLKVNSDREAAVDFTVPFMETGTSIVVAKRTGIISPTAFLEPFDAASWLLVGMVAVQLSAIAIYSFECVSPKETPPPSKSFNMSDLTLYKTYWLVWALLCKTPVHITSPCTFSARFMGSVWALFAVVFLAIYTANLAAFMISREEWDTYTGIQDPKLSNPMSVKPPLRFGTVPWTYTEHALAVHFPSMHSHMKQFNTFDAASGIDRVKKGQLDAFIYDGTVLNHMVAEDEECKLLTVGSWFAMTSYAVALPKNSKHYMSFNREIIEYKENGDLERLRRFWFTRSCNPMDDENKSTEPLAPEQFLSSFFLLFSGILLSFLILILELVGLSDYLPWNFHFWIDWQTRKDRPKSDKEKAHDAPKSKKLQHLLCQSRKCNLGKLHLQIELGNKRSHIARLAKRLEILEGMK